MAYLGNRPIKKYQRTQSRLKNASDTNRYVRKASVDLLPTAKNLLEERSQADPKF